MSTTPEVVAKKRGRPKKVVAVPEIESSATKKTCAATLESTTATTATTTSTNKKSTSTTTRTLRKYSPKTTSPPASKLVPIDQKFAAKKGSPTRQTKESTLSPDPAQETKNPPSAPSKILDDNISKAKGEPVDVKSRPRASVSNLPTKKFIESRTPSAESISHSRSTEIPGKQKTNEKRQPEARNTIQVAGEISESLAKSTGGKETIEPGKAAQQTQKPQTTPANYVDAAAVQSSKILNVLAASSKSAGIPTSVEDRSKRSSGSIGPSPVAATTDMSSPVRKKVSPTGSRQPPSRPPPVKPPLKQTAPGEAQRLRPQRPPHAPTVKPQDVKNTKQYKSLARR
ncbi:hypothetical protein EMCG_07905 [[Emmonsia] crescens]|uniref:Uncharacterized protein n=1 Tax=[Emmonsia] crescens TaxID=73230 RepID=A0A0G2JAV7_9EURO|nr:hypothetical protein EMCG_07905 [Emmonsia crescens UAMH 3008]